MCTDTSNTNPMIPARGAPEALDPHRALAQQLTLKAEGNEEYSFSRREFETELPFEGRKEADIGRQRILQRAKTHTTLGSSREVVDRHKS